MVTSERTVRSGAFVNESERLPIVILRFSEGSTTEVIRRKSFGVPQDDNGRASPRPRISASPSFFLPALALVLLTFIVGCKPPHNMEKQPYYRPYTPSPSFVDGMSERPLVPGVVPRPAELSPGIPYVAVRAEGPAGYDRLAPSRDIPFPITGETLARGQILFNVYCSVCHGRLGNGEGMIVQRGLTPPPSFHLERLRNESDAHFYDVISNGYLAMFSYSERIAPQDRWRVVAYIRALQSGAQRASNLNDDDRRTLAGLRP